MTTVRVTCLLCDHPVEVPSDGVVLHLDQGDDRYGFTCPGCGVYVVRRADDAVVAALLMAGVPVETGALPPWEQQRPGILLVDTGRVQRRPDARTEAPPLTEADVLLFREALADDQILAAWLAD